METPRAESLEWARCDRFAAIACAAVIYGCAGGGGAQGDSRPTFAELAAVTTSKDSASPSGGQLGMIASAKFVGHYIVVLDVMPPFLKLFDSSGTFIKSFANKGGGPGEMENPVAMTARGDTAITVATYGGRFLTWNLGGELLADTTMTLPPAMAMVDCNGHLLLYGPGAPTAGVSQWLRDLGDGSGLPREALRDSIIPGQPRGYGARPYGFVVRGDEFVLRHEFGPSPRVVLRGCSGTGEAHSLASLSFMEPLPSPSGSALPAPPKDEPVSLGLGALGDGTIVLADYYREGATRFADSTLLVFVSGSTRDSALVPGRVVIEDSRPTTGVLFARATPEPELLILREADLSSLRNRQ